MQGESDFDRGPWTPQIIWRDCGAVLCVPVESGFASYHPEFEITPEQAEILRTDIDRYFFLFAVLHERVQQAQGRMARMEANTVITHVLSSPRPVLERSLEIWDREAKGGLSNMVRIGLDRAGEPDQDWGWRYGSDS